MINEKIYLRDNDNVYMETYIVRDPLGDRRKRPAVVICPGGAYEFCSEREAEPVALNFNARGINAVVVYYSVKKLFPQALIDVSNAVVKIREKAEEWNVDPDKIIVCGFSAGGHLAASLGVFWNSEEAIKREDKMNKPNGMILSYPVITSSEKAHRGSVDTISKGDKALLEKVSLENWVNCDTPPTFIWHTFTDEAVPVENSIYMIVALRKNNISTEAHIYPFGPHGVSLATRYVSRGDSDVLKDVQEWIVKAINWIERL